MGTSLQGGFPHSIPFEPFFYLRFLFTPQAILSPHSGGEVNFGSGEGGHIVGFSRSRLLQPCFCSDKDLQGLETINILLAKYICKNTNFHIEAPQLVLRSVSQRIG